MLCDPKHEHFFEGYCHKCLGEVLQVLRAEFLTKGSLPEPLGRLLREGTQVHARVVNAIHGKPKWVTILRYEVEG